MGDDSLFLPGAKPVPVYGPADGRCSSFFTVENSCAPSLRQYHTAGLYENAVNKKNMLRNQHVLKNGANYGT